MNPTQPRRLPRWLHRLYHGFLLPPVFEDEDRTLRAGLLNVALWTIFAMTAMLLLGNLTNGFRYPAVLPFEIGLLGFCLALNWLMRRGHVGWATYLMMVVGTACVSLILFIFGNVSAVISGTYLITVMLGGLLLRPRYAVLTSILTAATVVAMLWIERLGLLPAITPVDPLTRSITWIGMISATTGLVMLTRHRYLNLLERYRTELAERRRAEEALRYSQARLLGLVSAIPDFIFVVDTDGKYHDVFTSDGSSLGETARRLRGHRVSDVYPPDEAQAFLDVIGRAAGAGPNAAPIEYEYVINLDQNNRVSHAEGSEKRWFQARIMGYDAPEGRRVLWLARETTAAHKATRALQRLTADLEQRVQERTARLEEVNRELEAFAYTVSHDLRSPLRALGGYARLLDEDYGPGLPQDARDMLTMLRKGAARMNTQIDDLLRLADRPLQRQALPMRLLAESAAHSAVTACEPGRRVQFRIDDLPAAHADPDLIERVLVNLLDNALKFTRPCAEAVIHIGAQPNGGSPVYFVADNGIGFEMSAAERIFAPFQRLHPEQEFEGSGLGLASARRIVERHGGRIWADSRPGSGATFYFTLPE